MPPNVLVEVLLLSERDGCLRFRVIRAPLQAQMHPDDVARRLAGLTPCTGGGLLHSTSWRPDDEAIVLTYAAVPDLDPEQETRLVQVDAMVHGGHPLAPSPSVISIDAVAAHACRHLAMLRATDAQVACSATRLPEFWQLIAKLMPGTAGALTSVALGQKW